MSRTIGLVVPAFRPDVDTLLAYVRDLAATLESVTIRIELDDPRPGTCERLADAPATVNAVDRRRGKGAAITAGFRALETDADVLAFVDADGATAVDSVAAVLEPVLEGECELAVGTRRHPDADVVTSQSRLRGRLGDGYAWLARRLLPVSLTDYQCGAKAISRDAWVDVRDHLHETGFAWDVELVAVAATLGHRIVEVPVTWADAPDSTVSSIGTPPGLAAGLVRTSHRVRRLEGSYVHDWIAKRIPEPRPVVDTRACTDGRSHDGVDDDE